MATAALSLSLLAGPLPAQDPGEETRPTLDGRSPAAFADSLRSLCKTLVPAERGELLNALELIQSLAPDPNGVQHNLHGKDATAVLTMAAELRTQIDRNGDGEVDKEELAVARAKILSAQIRTNQERAVQFLRQITRAQQRALRLGLIDTDDDGNPEYATLAELTGWIGLRDSFGQATERRAGTRLLNRPQHLGAGRYVWSGYVIQLWLPTTLGAVTDGGPGDRVCERAPDADAAEQHFCAYAWPLHQGQTGELVYALTQEGTVLCSDNQHQGYGQDQAPEPYAVFAVGTRALGSALLEERVRNDGGVWVPLHNGAATPN